MKIYYMTNNCINIDDRLNRYAWIRNETLNRCYAIENYKDLPLKEKNRIYDQIRKEVEQGE